MPSVVPNHHQCRRAGGIVQGELQDGYRCTLSAFQRVHHPRHGRAVLGRGIHGGCKLEKSVWGVDEACDRDTVTMSDQLVSRGRKLSLPVCPEGLLQARAEVPVFVHPFHRTA